MQFFQLTDLVEELPGSARCGGCYFVHHPGIFSVSTPNCADQQYCSAKVVVNLVQSFSYRAQEGRAVEKRKDDVEVIEVTIHEMSHKVHVRVFKLHGWRLEYGGHPLGGRVKDRTFATGTKLTSGAIQNSFLRSCISRPPAFWRLSLNT